MEAVFKQICQIITECMMSTLSMNRSGSYISNEGEQANPETAFSKLMAINDDTPIKQCKMLLDSMKEENLFEKNVIRNTQGQAVPLHFILEKRRSDNFRNYERLLNYSKKKRDSEDFRKKSAGKVTMRVGRSKAITLKQFVTQKKVKMLTESSKHETDDRVIESILRDDKARERLFDESILMERFHYVRKQEGKAEEQGCTVPAKFRGLNPKHLRMPEQCRDENSFYRRKYVHHQRTFQYFKNALEVEGNLLRTKQAENNLVIRNLMGHFSQQVLNSKGDDISKISQCVHRLFLRYANSDTEDLNKMYKFISRERLEALLAGFGIEYTHNQQVMHIITHYEITQFYFLEILHLLSINHHDPFTSDIKTLLNTKILNKPELYLPREWILYGKHKNFILKQMKVRRFKEKLQWLHGECIKGGSDSGSYTFDQMVQVMWVLRIYPFMVSKKQLRFFYLYTQCEQIGVSINNIADIYIYIALSKEGKVETNIKDIIKLVVSFTHDAVA